MAPQRLHELRLALLSGERTRASLAPLCDVRPWGAAGESVEDAHLLLVEPDAGTAPDEVLVAVESARGAGCPSAIWLTRQEDVSDFPADVIARFDRVFATDSLALKLLAERLDRTASIVPLGLRVPPPSNLSAGGRIAYVGGFSPDWPGRSRVLAEALLDAALAHGLMIPQGDGDDLGSLPERFRASVVPDPGGGWSAECRAVVVFVPAGRVPSVPEIAFEALASGLLVVMRSSDAWQLLPGRIVNYVSEPDRAAGIVAWCMQRADEQHERASAGRAVVLGAHTMASRLATITSAFEMAVLA